MNLSGFTLFKMSSVSDCNSAGSCMRDKWAWSSRLVFTWGSLYLGLLILLGRREESWKKIKNVNPTVYISIIFNPFKMYSFIQIWIKSWNFAFTFKTSKIIYKEKDPYSWKKKKKNRWRFSDIWFLQFHCLQLIFWRCKF